MASNTKRFPCSLCGRSYDAKPALEQHVRDSHPSNKASCSKCPRTYDNKEALEQHMRDSHTTSKVVPGNGKNFKCIKCTSSFSSEQSLEQHMQASHQLEQGQGTPTFSSAAVIACAICLKKFSSPLALAQHKETHMKQERPKGDMEMKCTFCNRLCKSKKALDQHIADKHSSGDVLQSAAAGLAVTAAYKCNHCAGTFSSEVQLLQHQKGTGHDKTVQNPRKAYIENQFIKDPKVTITPEDQKKSVERVMNVLKKLIEHIRGQKFGKIYIPDIRKAGSTAVGAKIGMADEFDTNIPIKVDVLDVVTNGTFSYIYKDKVSLPSLGPSPKNLNIARELCDGPATNIPQGQAVVKVDPKTTPDDLMHRGDLIPHKVLQDFYSKLVVALRETKLDSQGVHLSREAHGPALTLTLRQDGQHDISVDLTISLECKSISVNSQGWPHQKTRVAYTPEKIDEICRAGMHLVPKGDETWSISYSRAEKAILGNIDAGNGCRKAVLKFLKRHFQICKSRSQDGLPGISSHIMKTLILWASEENPGNDYWNESNVDQRAIDTMLKLEKCLTNGTLPYYFCLTTNVLANKDKQTLNRLASYMKEERLKLEAMSSK